MPRLEYSRRRRAAMMAVGNIQAGHRRKGGADGGNGLRLADRPGGMPHAVGGGEIRVGRPRGVGRSQIIHELGCAINQEDGAGLRVERFDMAHAVVLLVGVGQFVFFDEAAEIIVATGGGGQAGLAVAAHDLAVEVESGLGVANQGAIGQQPRELFPAPGIDAGVVGVDVFRQVDFRLADAQKAQRVAARQGAGLRRRHDVIRQFADTPGQFGLRAHSGKWGDVSHQEAKVMRPLAKGKRLGRKSAGCGEPRFRGTGISGKFYPCKSLDNRVSLQVIGQFPA